MKLILIMKEEFYNDDGTFNNFKLLDRLEYLNNLVKSCSFSNKLALTCFD